MQESERNIRSILATVTTHSREEQAAVIQYVHQITQEARVYILERHSVKSAGRVIIHNYRIYRFNRIISAIQARWTDLIWILQQRNQAATRIQAVFKGFRTRQENQRQNQVANFFN